MVYIYFLILKLILHLIIHTKYNSILYKNKSTYQVKVSFQLNSISFYKINFLTIEIIEIYNLSLRQ